MQEEAVQLQGAGAPTAPPATLSKRQGAASAGAITLHTSAKVYKSNPFEREKTKGLPSRKKE
jgi:hypothetical protein